MNRRLIISAVIAVMALMVAIGPVGADHKVSTNTMTARPAAEAEVIQDGGFELGSPNPYWTESSQVWPGLLVPDAIGANSGTWYAWMGGADGNSEVSVLSQTVTIQNGGSPATLSFYFSCNSDSPGDGDVFQARIDGNPVYTYSNCSILNWTLVTVSVDAYADGGQHIVSFYATDNQGDNSNWFVDDVSLVDTASLVYGVTCDGSDDLQITITAGDGPFNITGTGAGLPLNGVGTGVHTLPGPGPWSSVTITETTGNTESVDTGGWDCSGNVFLNANAACQGDGSLLLNIVTGDGPFNITGTGGGLPLNGVGIGQYSLTGGTWTGVTVAETTGDMQSTNLGDYICGVDLVVGATCNADDLVVTITSGDGLFEIAATAGPGLPQTVAEGVHTIPGPGPWTGVTVTEQTGDMQVANLGDIDCFSALDLAATAACVGDDMQIVISAGDFPFFIEGTGTGLPVYNQGIGVYTFTGPGTWTNVSVNEHLADQEIINFGDVTCPAPPPLNPPGIPVPNKGLIQIGTWQAQPAYMSPGGEIIPGIVLPNDADGNGFDTYVVTGASTVDGRKWYSVFLGSANWGWVPADMVTPLTALP